MKTILEIKDLCVHIRTKDKILTVADHISLDLKKNEILGLVGESGSGKTMTALALTHLIPNNANAHCEEYHFNNEKIDFFNREDVKKLRAKGISYIFQEPSSYMDPLFCIGDQIKECLRYNGTYSDKAAKEEAIHQLETVGLSPGRYYYGRFAHQLSGGMNQRVMIAIAISCHPKILIADEPTTALDVAIEQSIVKLIQRLVKENDLSIIWITHDISLIQTFSDRLAVMYAGRIVEIGKSSQIYSYPAHPYTRALMNCLPERLKEKRFTPITGDVADLSHLPQGCKFSPRCPYALDKCALSEPSFSRLNEEQKAKCYLLQKN